MPPAVKSFPQNNLTTQYQHVTPATVVTVGTLRRYCTGVNHRRSHGLIAERAVGNRIDEASSVSMMSKGAPLTSAMMQRHDAAVAAGHATYRDPATGFDVFTSVALAERGYCCANVCRHCPFATDAAASAPRPA
jgi:hypothetical protein